MIRTGATLVIMFAHALTAAAQPPAAVPLTMDEAIQRAITHSQRLAEARARGEGAAAAVSSNEAAEWPTVTFSGSYRRTNFIPEFAITQPNGTQRVLYPNIPNLYLMRASMQWPIYTAGRTDALNRAAEAEASAAASENEIARADLRLEVARVYWALVTAGETVRVVQEGLVRADAHLRDVRSRFENGLIPPNEVSSVEAQRAREEMELIEARNLQQSIAEDLRRLTGISGEVLPVEPLAPGARDSAGEMPQRPEIAAITSRIDAAQQRVEAIHATQRPSISVVGVADYASPNVRRFPLERLWRTSWEIGISGTWTLWDAGRTAADLAQAGATVKALRARQSDVTSIIDTEVRQRRLDLDSAHGALKAATAAVDSAGEARRVVNQRFGVGVATSTELLDAHVALLEAELNRTRALANIRLAEARLDRALGR
jgi:outer membrane protein TolC